MPVLGGLAQAGARASSGHSPAQPTPSPGLARSLRRNLTMAVHVPVLQPFPCAVRIVCPRAPRATRSTCIPDHVTRTIACSFSCSCPNRRGCLPCHRVCACIPSSVFPRCSCCLSSQRVVAWCPSPLLNPCAMRVDADLITSPPPVSSSASSTMLRALCCCIARILRRCPSTAHRDGTAAVRAHSFVVAAGGFAGMARPLSTRVESGH